MMASPSTSAPVWSTSRHLSPSPSKATPSASSRSRTSDISACGCVDPHSRLMLRPSGDAPMTSTSNPSASKSSGAMVVVAPCAQSMPMRSPDTAPESGSASRAWAM